MPTYSKLSNLFKWMTRHKNNPDFQGVKYKVLLSDKGFYLSNSVNYLQSAIFNQYFKQ